MPLTKCRAVPSAHAVWPAFTSDASSLDRYAVSVRAKRPQSGEEKRLLLWTSPFSFGHMDPNADCWGRGWFGIEVAPIPNQPGLKPEA